MTPRKEVIGDAELWLGDCRGVLPMLGPVDAVVTDPPYGVGFNYENYVDDPEKHGEMCVEWLRLMRSISAKVLVFTGIENLFCWPKPDWIACWHKPFSMGLSPFGSNNWEPVAVYGSPGRNDRQSDWFNACTVRRTEDNPHPCPKPIEAMLGAITIASKLEDTILDPFMGSGTTGVACARLGRRFIGIEIHEPYFNIACRRIEQAYRQADMFVHRPAPKPAVTADLFAAHGDGA